MSDIELDRLWYYTEQDVVSEDFQLDVKQLLVFRLPRIIFRKGARYFSDVLDDERSKNIYNLFLVFCEFIQRLRHLLSSNPDSELQTFFEVVEAEMGFSEGGGLSTRHIYHHPSQFGCIEELLQERLHNERLDIFLPDVPEVAVAEYRIWVCMKNLHAMDALKSILQEVDVRQNSNNNRFSIPAHFQNRNQEPPQPWQPWLNLKGVEEFTYWVDNYGGTILFSSADARSRAKLDFQTSHPNQNNGGGGSTVTEETEVRNARIDRERHHPLNPLNYFNHVHIFRDQIQSNPIVESQRLMSQYILRSSENGLDFKFPKHKNVLSLAPSALKPESMYNKYLPDFQKGMIVVDDLPFASGEATEDRRRKRSQCKSMVIYRQPPEPQQDVDWDEYQRSILGIHEEWTVDRYREDGTSNQPILNPQVLTGIVNRPKNSRVDSVQTMSSLEKIRQLSHADIPIIYQQWKKSPADFRKSYLEHQNWVFDEFSACVLQGNATLSDAAQHIVNEIINTDLLDTPRRLNISDVKLDIFGNMVASRLLAYEKLLFLYATHRQFMLLQMGSYDAFRHDFNLHYNAMLIGASNTSKSYALDLLEDCAVKGSVQALSYQTKKADAAEGEQNDLVTVMNEFSLKAVSEAEKSNGDVTTMEALMKEKATSMKMRVKLLQITENGERITRITFSSCIGCWFGASNDDPSQVSESFASRFHWDMFQVVERPGISIVDIEDAEKRLPALERQKIQKFKDWMRQMQCLHWLVEKLIMTGGLTDVSLTATNFIVTAVNNYLLARNVHVHNRIFKRIKIQARLFTIHLALHYLYFVPIKILSPELKLIDNFYGQPFELEQLKCIDLYLRDEESIVYFILGLMREQIVNPIEDVVRKCLRDLHDQRKTEMLRYLGVGSRYEHSPSSSTRDNDGCDNESIGDKWSQHAVNGTTTEADDGKEDVRTNKYVQQSISAASTSSSSTPTETGKDVHQLLNTAYEKHFSLADTGKNIAKTSNKNKNKNGDGGGDGEGEEGKMIRMYSYSYLKIGKHKDQVPKYIQSHYMSISKPSFFQIKAAWEKICNGQNMLHMYKAHPDGPDHFPVRDESFPKTMQPLVIVENNEVYVHADVLSNSSLGQDVLMEAIESTFHKYTRARDIVFGEQYNYTHPHLFRIISLKPTDKIFTTTNPLYMDKRSSSILSQPDDDDDHDDDDDVEDNFMLTMRKIPVFYLDEDLDTRSCGERLSLLGINPTTPRIQAIHPRYLMGFLMLDSRRKKVNESLRYPKSFLNSNMKKNKDIVEDLQQVEETMPAALSSKSRSALFSQFLEQQQQQEDGELLGFLENVTENVTERENTMEIVDEEDDDDDHHQHAAARALSSDGILPMKEIHKSLVSSESTLPVSTKKLGKRKSSTIQQQRKKKKKSYSSSSNGDHVTRLAPIPAFS